MTTASAAVELDVPLDRASPVPLYHQLAMALEAAIHDGRLRPGDRLENELAMTSRLGLARPTARQAIGELVRKGLLVRKRGVGTQVVGAPVRRDMRLSSLHDDLASPAARRRPRCSPAPPAPPPSWGSTTPSTPTRGSSSCAGCGAPTATRSRS